MKVLLVSPLGFPVNMTTRYAGIERLVWEYARELHKQGHDVIVTAHPKSTFPEGIKKLSTVIEDNGNIADELNVFQRYQSYYYMADIIHDFSHQHIAGRFMQKLPTLNIFWHAPALAAYPKSTYNIIGLSEWACREFKRVYNQDARYQQSIAINTELMKPAQKKRNNRFLTLGRMSEEKGNLRALSLCKKAGVPLDVAGGRGQERAVDDPPTPYERHIQVQCNSPLYKFLGEVTENHKVRLMKSNRCLIYATNHPEVTSHKIQECMLCGMPVIVPRLGALPEIVTHGVDGFLCSTDEEYIEAIKNVDSLTMANLKDTRDKYSVETVVRNYVSLYEKVANGERW